MSELLELTKAQARQRVLDTAQEILRGCLRNSVHRWWTSSEQRHETCNTALLALVTLRTASLEDLTVKRREVVLRQRDKRFASIRINPTSMEVYDNGESKQCHVRLNIDRPSAWHLRDCDRDRDRNGNCV